MKNITNFWLCCLKPEFVISLTVFVMHALLEFVKGHPFTKVLFAIVYLTAGFIITSVQFILYILVKSWNARLFRRLNAYLTYSLHTQLTFLIEWWTSSEFNLFTDPECIKQYIAKEHAILITNHGKDIEGFFPWVLADHFGVLGNIRGVIKKALAYAPIYGWSWTLQEHVFLQRDWAKDEKNFGAQLRRLTEYEEPMWLTILPEGTRISQQKLEISQKIAREKGLPVLNHILLPRTRGFITVVRELRGKVSAIYDLTAVIKKAGEEDVGFADLFDGKKISFKIMLKRYPISEVPSNEKELAEWLHARYQEKDKLIENVLNTGEFDPDAKSALTEEMSETVKNFTYVDIPGPKSCLINILAWAVIILGPLFTYLIQMLTQGKYVSFGLIILTMYAASILLDKVIDLSKASLASSYGQTSSKPTLHQNYKYQSIPASH